VLFDKICRHNGIMHRLTAPRSPNQNGKVERFHGTFRPDFLPDAEPFRSVEAAQQAVDAWVEQYNTNRPQQALDPQAPVMPADRFTPIPEDQAADGGPHPGGAGDPAERAMVERWLPPTLEPLDGGLPEATPAPASPVGEAIELEKVVPASGNMSLAGSSSWLGRARAGQRVLLWVDCDLVHLSIGGTRSRPSAPTCPSTTWPGWPPTAPDPRDHHPCTPRLVRMGWSRWNGWCPGPAPVPSGTR
jgi:hypothetical protein